MTDISALEAYAGQIAEAAAKSGAASEKQHEYIHGDAQTDVFTESGFVPTIAKQARLSAEATAGLEGKLADPTNGSTLVGFIQAGTGSVSRTVQDKLRERTTPLDKGAAADGVTDDSAALANLSAFNGVIDGLGKTYVTGAITFAGKISLRNITFRPTPAFAGQVLVTISGDDSFIEFTVDAAGKGITCVDVTGNRVVGTATAKNVTGVPQAVGGTQSGCRVSGQRCQVLVRPQNFQKGTSDNDSIPRAATADLSGAGTGNNNIISVIGDSQIAGLVCSQPQVYVPTINIDGLLDNGIYHLGGNLDVGDATFKNALDETVVTEGTCRIRKMTVIDGHGSAGIQNGNLTIDEYIIESSNPARSYIPLRSRTGNITSNVKIGTLRGEIYLTDAANGAGIFQLLAGEVTDLVVDDLDLKVHYRTGSTKVLMNDDNGKKVSFGSMAIELVDDTATLTTADKFDFRIPPSITKQSYIGPVNNVSATGDIRVVNAIQSLVQIAPEMEVSVTNGPYILQENTASPCPRRVIGTGVPTVGAWLRGDVIEIKAPFISGVSEYTCTAVGPPLTWRASKWVTGRGTSASRPTLTANDTGVNYLDNTLSSFGKPIWWNGTSWVDSSGSIV